MAERLTILASIPGISKITAFTLLIEMPELGQIEAKQAASLVGLAPIARQSGRWTGRAFIRGGRASLKQAHYMPALVAARFHPDLKAKYKHLRDAESREKSPSPQSCASCSSLQMPSCATSEPGNKKPLEKYGYSSLRTIKKIPCLANCDSSS
jgi:hypothetical protein